MARTVWMAPVRVHPPSLPPETSFDTGLQLGPEERECIAERCATLAQSDGAREVAIFIEDMAYSHRADRL